MARLSSTYFKPSNDVKRKYRSRSLADMTPNPQIQKQKHLSDDEASKKFDQLLSSPRLKMECNESVAPDMTSRFSKQSQLCLVCYERDSNMINMPCGHGGFCQECAESLLRKSDTCVLCRKVRFNTSMSP